VLEVCPALRRPVGDRRQREVGEHESNGPVERLSTPLAPRRHRLGDTPFGTAQLTRLAQLPPGLLRDEGQARSLEEGGALLLGPAEPPARREPVGDHAMELDEVGDVVRRVLALLCAERPARPVRQLVALLEAQPQQLLDERDERGRRQAEEPRRELRVEKPRRGGAARPFEDLEVLVGGVDDGQSRTGKHGGEGRDVDGERVDERDPAVPGDLKEGQPGEVAPLTVELGVERVLVGAPELVDESAERDLVGDVTEFDGWRPVRAPTGTRRRCQSAQPP